MAGSAALARDSRRDYGVRAVIAKTRDTHATYSLFSWNVITPPDAPPYEEWSAEFNAGFLHRVETPRIRVIANCKLRSGMLLEVETGRTTEGPEVAATACGIDNSQPFIEASLVGESKGKWGTVTNLRIRTADMFRTYAIEPRGIIVAETISDPDGQLRLTMKAREIRNWVPRDIFTVGSLQQSFVGNDFRSAPKE
jgi:hypothetical protein